VNPKTKLLAITSLIIIVVLSIAAYSQAGQNTSAQPLRVACVGDSITRGSGYPAKLQSLLGSNYNVANFGVDGAAVTLSSERPYMNQSQFQMAQNFQPDIVVVMLGTNDANTNATQYDNTFEDDYTKLVTSFQSLNSNPQVWVAVSPPIQNNSLELSAPYFEENIIPHLHHVAQDLNLPTINVYDSFQNHPDFFMDGVHPDSDGATLIACDVCIAITPESWS
jgi:acyl-CoA thioesterase-1